MARWPTLFSSRAQSTQPARISLTFYFFLAGTFLLTLVPHVLELPAWVSVSVGIAIIIRSFMEVYRVPLPSTTFCSLVALCLLCGVLLQFKTVLGRDAGMAFTAGLLAIKFFELRGPRDVALIIFSGYFVVMSALLFSQVIELFIYCLIMMWVLTALLRRLQIGDQPEDHLLPMLRWAGLIFLQALPLTVFLFFFFPRYSGKLQLNMGETALGFTDTVRPGDIANLSKNTDEAMYVKFTSDVVPSVDMMYWRGLALWHYQGGAWTAGPWGEARFHDKDQQQPQEMHGSPLINQEITIYPHFQKWLFALDWPIRPAVDDSEPQPWSIVRHGDILQLAADKGKVDHKERYTVSSCLTLKEQTLSKAERDIGTDLPLNSPNNEIDQDIRDLAERLWKENPDPQVYTSAVRRYFRQEHFVYTASPGVMAKDGRWLHEFLFVTKAGFCEHYASAFAVLMRLKKIPARVIVGYQGATFNPYKNIYTVSQSNAHAWDEVWISSKIQPDPSKTVGHWLRVDPTAYLPPGQGAQPDANNSGQENGGDELSAQASRREKTFSETHFPGWMHQTLTEMQLRREQIEADWDDLVFSYDPTAQDRLAQILGFGRNSTFLLGLSCLVTVGLFIGFYRIWIRRKPPLSPVEDMYASFCRSMAQRGVPRATWEGPLAYTGRVAEAFPEKNEAIRSVGSIVANSRYGPPYVNPVDSTELKSLLLLITASQAASSSREQN